MPTSTCRPQDKINAILEAAENDNNRDLTDAELQEIAALESKAGQRRSKPDGFAAPRASRPRGGKRFAEMFGRDSLANDGWESFEDYLATIHSGLHHANLRPAIGASMSGGVPSAGGFIVPEEYAARMLDKSLENEIVRPRCQVEPMQSETKKIGGFSDTDHTGGSLYGGFTAQWLGEGSTATDATPKFRQIELKAKKLAIFTKASNELIADGMSFEQMLGEALVAATGWHLDYAALRGTGSGQPLGVLNDPALVTVTKETSQAAATVLYENVAKMFARLHPACVGNSVWVANPTCIPQLLQLSVAVGTGGAFIPVLQESGGQFTMLTRPVLFTEKLPALGTVGDIALVDFSQYTIGLRAELSLEKSVHVGWQTDESGYRIILRADGQGRWKSPLTPATGDSLSWCVALQTRS